jgi:hypothetical protein
MREPVLLLRQLLTGQHACVDVPPALRQVGENLVMGSAHELGLRRQLVIRAKSPRNGEVAHVAIEHGERHRRVFHKHRQLRLAFGQHLLGPFAFADVDQHVDGTGQSSRAIEQRGRIANERNQRRVGTLSDRLSARHRALLLQGQRHWALVVRQRRAIGPVKLPRPAEPLNPQLRPAAPEPGRGLVVKAEASLRVRHLDGGWKGLDRRLGEPSDTPGAGSCILAGLSAPLRRRSDPTQG